MLLMIILIKTEYLQFSEQRCLLLPWLILRRPSARPRLDSQEPVSPCDLLHHRGSITLEPAVSLSCSGHVLQTPETVMYETTFLSHGDDSMDLQQAVAVRTPLNTDESREVLPKSFFSLMSQRLKKKELLSNQIKAIFNPFVFFFVFFSIHALMLFSLLLTISWMSVSPLPRGRTTPH